jgi:hypothetical protein
LGDNQQLAGASDQKAVSAREEGLHWRAGGQSIPWPRFGNLVQRLLGASQAVLPTDEEAGIRDGRRWHASRPSVFGDAPPLAIRSDQAT